MWKNFLKLRKKSNDQLDEAEKQGLITKEEKYRLKYERAKTDYEDILKKATKKK